MRRALWRERPLLTAAALLFLIAPARAHEVSRSQARLAVHGAEVRGRVTVDLVELSGVDRNRDDVVTFDELEPEIDRIYAGVKSHLSLRGPDAPTRTTVGGYDVVDNHLLVLDMVYAFNARVTELAVTSTLHELMRPDHRHFVSVRFGTEVQDSVLAAGSPTAVFAPAAPPSRYQTVRRFLTLGVDHIITGYDHLAFLVCLLVATTTFRALVTIITAFTVAHSVTLALATFNLVVLPTRLVESVIALSIAYVALENLLQFRALERFHITFLFGLVHGFGFANVLRQMELPPGTLAWSLFSFNAGVEVGQIAFVAMVFPLVLASRRRLPELRPAVSASIVCLAMYWFVQRAFLG